ncbi:hypothetical protein [Brevibacterium atlanticum]|uniref:hypothetical protein n=1 Tax=Brevibacterium atlanticum TaxID=2697563 RepID=UPI00142288D4|nr:hypothetical protein [Brevibacterium atlanticum]
MRTIIRRHIRRQGKVSIAVGCMLVVMAALAVIVAIVLAFVIDTRFLLVLFGSLILLTGAGVNFWMGSRARLEIAPERFIWCGFVGRAHRIAWRDLDRILLPAPGSRPRLVAAARLRDGSVVEINALWVSPTNPANLFSAPDLSHERRVLIDGHRAFLDGLSR